MALEIEYIKRLLDALNFKIKDGVNGIWEKEFSNHNKYKIQIDLNNKDLTKCKIDYGTLITIGRNTTTNFSQGENLVVLECVNRLLEKGYSPKNISLEKTWKVGGHLDVFVTDKSDKAYLMIECKQWGKEYNKAIKIILQNDYKKEQLFNYYLNEPVTKYLSLYASTLDENNEIIYRNDIINSEMFRGCENQLDIYQKWDKTFQVKGIFEKNILPYNVKFLGLIKSDLKTMDTSFVDTNDADGSIYNRFAEILRRHTVSDKNNAYNKIFNLFLCKIVDEDNSSENDELNFQWKDGQSPVDVLTKLNDLYKQGMKDYLKLDVADITEEEFDTELNNLLNRQNTNNSKIREMFQMLRLYKNNEFAFKEVIDERTFFENSEVVKEVVKLLEGYKIKYSHKQQFLGDFFERLLNIGVKQEAGQFFTPIPIANFICKSIDFEGIINKKIQEKDQNFLPYLIDYSCGSGHFLTEAMDRVDKILQSKSEDDFKSKPQKDNSIGWKVSYKWASEFVYGIERDYRLAKTTKVASFLNGDGEANILYADGLDSFNSDLYIGKLKSNSSSKDNPVFDVVLANPPYSVENFKFNMHKGDESFELFKSITDKSDDIECLFIERTKQLLKEDGVAGIILPSTILLNSGIHQRARDIIIKYFSILGVSEFGKNTFSATGQNTVVLFLKRRNDNYWLNANKLVDTFFTKKTDFSFDNKEQIVNHYLENIYPELSLKEYVEKFTDKNFLKDEKLKLLYFLLTFNQTTIFSHYGEKTDEEKKFLGYEHSDMKKYEGIHPYPHNEERKINSMLFDENSLTNPNKISSYILSNYKGEKFTVIPKELSNHIEIKKLYQNIDFTSDDFKFRIYVKNLDNKFLTVKKYPLTTLADKEIAEILDHLRKPVKKAMRTSGKYPYYGATGKTGQIDDFIFDEKLVLIGEDGAKWRKGENTGYIIEGKSWVNNHAHVVKPNTSKLLHEYLIEIFAYLDFSYLKSRPNGGKLLKSDMTSIKFPLPKVSEQEDILKKLKGKVKDERYDLFEELIGIEK